MSLARIHLQNDNLVNNLTFGKWQPICGEKQMEFFISTSKSTDNLDLEDGISTYVPERFDWNDGLLEGLVA